MKHKTWDQNKKKDPWACIDGATQGKNQHGYWDLHESKKPLQQHMKCSNHVVCNYTIQIMNYC
jgi:hypothetical protein